MSAILSITCKSILSFCGWNPEYEDEGIKDLSRSVVIFPHTSFWDFIIIIFYFGSKPQYLSRLYTLMKPQVFDYFGGFLRFLNCIPAPKIENSNNGFVKEISNYFKDIQVVKFLISPKGTIKKSEWKKGYYYIAKELGADVVIYGLDYEQKCLKFISKNELIGDVEEFTEDMKKQMFDIVTLYPENECASRPHNSHELSVVDPLVFSMNLSSIISLFFLYRYNKISFIISTLSCIVSHKYHISKEKKYREADFGLAALSIFTFLYNLYKDNKFPHDFFSTVILLSAFITYLIGSGREKKQVRTRTYIVCHSLFHLFSGMFVVRAILR